ncbi:MAG: VCBS repeat-containing protein [Acidobacteria bacterium]|nr:VCBS repeat-containing protein [Acidobacteriota bacterium]
MKRHCVIAILLPFLTLSTFAGSLTAPISPNTLFEVPKNYGLGLNPLDRKFADLDGDGNLDVVAVNGGQANPAPTMTIRYGSPGGKFGDAITTSTPLIGAALAVGDLNQDGRPDIVIASYYENRIAVFRNVGGRRFTAGTVSIPPNPNSPLRGEYFGLAIGDFDGDGSNDVVALEDQQDQRLRFFHRNSNDELTVFQTLEQQSGGVSYEAVMTVGDINSDGHPDVVLAGGGPFGVRRIRFVLGRPTAGNLGIEDGPLISDEVVGISMADLDGDADVDMALAFYDTTTPTTHSIQIFRNNGIGLDFTPVPRVEFAYPFPCFDIAIADFDNDGRPDVATLLGSNLDIGIFVAVQRNVGNLQLGQPTYYGVGRTSNIGMADVDHDGWIDLLVSSPLGLQSDYTAYNNISTGGFNVLKNESGRRFGAPFVKLWGPDFIDAGKFNGDRYLDMISSWATDWGNVSGADISISDRKEGFFEEVSYPSPASLTDMHAGDFNGDGISDAVTTHAWNNTRQVAVYFGLGDGTLLAPVVSTLPSEWKTTVVGRFNADGKDDLFVIDGNGSGTSMLSVGDGTFQPATTTPIPSLTIQTKVATGDFDSDGDLDVITTGTSSMSLWLNTGDGGFTGGSTTIPLVKDPVVGDINGDHNLDIVGWTGPIGTLPPWRTDVALAYVLGNGSGGFGNLIGKNIPNFSNFMFITSIAVADFDLDGYDDVALIQRENTFGNLIVMLSAGANGQMQDPIYPPAGPATKKLVVADFDSDGDPDIEWLGYNSRGVIFNRKRSLPSNSPFDFDGDGKTDASVYRPSNNVWYLQRSTAGFTAYQFGAAGDKMVPADYTGDGKTDVAMYRPSTGTWYILRSEDLTLTVAPFGISTDIPTPGDFDGDGKADMAVYRPDAQGTFYIQRSTQGFTAVQFGLAGDKPTTADFDGDGKADIAVYRPSTGVWYRFNSSNGAFWAAQFGAAGDKVVPADYTGDGKTDLAVYRPSTGFWYVLRSENDSAYGAPFGISTDIPAAGDYDGDGKADFAVYRPDAQGLFYILGSSAGFSVVPFGLAGDVPAPSAYVN